MEALAVLLHAEGLPAGAALALLRALELGGLAGLGGDDVAVDAVVLAVFLVAAVHASAILVALLTGREALAVQFHALGVAAVADFLLEWLLALFGHFELLKFKYRSFGAGQYGSEWEGWERIRR